MKNALKIFLLSAFLFPLFGLSQVQAVGLSDAFGNNSITANFSQQAGYSTDSRLTPEYYVGVALNALFALLGTGFLAIVLINGFIWMTADGNEDKVKKSKKSLKGAAIGLLIVLGSYAISYFVLNVFIK